MLDRTTQCYLLWASKKWNCELPSQSTTCSETFLRWRPMTAACVYVCIFRHMGMSQSLAHPEAAGAWEFSHPLDSTCLCVEVYFLSPWSLSLLMASPWCWANLGSVLIRTSSLCSRDPHSEGSFSVHFSGTKWECWAMEMALVTKYDVISSVPRALQSEGRGVFPQSYPLTTHNLPSGHQMHTMGYTCTHTMNKFMM